MDKFSKYIKRIELKDLVLESTNTFTYNLPDNRRKRLFDFYTFSSLSPLVYVIQENELKTVKSYSGEVKTFGARKLNSNFVDSFWRSFDKCYINLANEMLDDILFCISAEFKHINQDPSFTMDAKIPETLNKDIFCF